jgi:hypothetical protein
MGAGGEQVAGLPTHAINLSAFGAEAAVSTNAFQWQKLARNGHRPPVAERPIADKFSASMRDRSGLRSAALSLPVPQNKQLSPFRR